MQITAFHDCGSGGYIAKLADGTQYGFNPAVDDPAPMHQAVVAAFKAQAAPVVREVRDSEAVKRYLENRIDEIATQRMKAPTGAQDHAQKIKIEEARDVLDMLSTDGAALSSFSAEELISRYPLLSASAAAGGQTIADTARLIQAKALKQRDDISKLEHWRLTAKRDIRAAVTAEQAEVAFQKAVTATG
jgi:hypothetical protein